MDDPLLDIPEHDVDAWIRALLTELPTRGAA
jgi:hypothetical protein